MIRCEFENGNQASLRHVTVAVFLIKGDEILLGKRADHLLEGGKWGPLGGFLQRNETMSEGAAREVLEESGYTARVDAMFYLSDHPNRPGEDRQNLHVVYLAEAKEKVQDTDLEMQELQWFPINALPQDHVIAFDFAVPLRLLQRYRVEPFALPVIQQ